MALSDEQRGPRAAWLYRHRVARFGSGQGGLAALGEELRGRGAYRAPDTIKGWEASDERSPIPADIVPHLVEIFDDPYPSPAKPASTAELVAALAAQTEAINALVSRIDQLLPSERIREMVAWASENMPSSPSQGPTPGPAGSRARP